MFGTLVAIETLLAFSGIPEEPLVEPAAAWLLVVSVVAVAAGLLWLLTRGGGAGRGAETPLVSARRPRWGRPVRFRHAH